MSKRFEALNSDPRVSSAHVESDGGELTYWIELKPGWTSNPRDAHDIAESTAAAALRKFKNVEPCDCADCKR